MHGVLNLYKPSGISSFDCIRHLRRVLGSLPLGHAGTLDPMARGVLIILIGAATRLSRFFLHSDKEYEAEVLFGKETDTDDITGRILAEAPVPRLALEELQQLLNSFLGIQPQVPPTFSALKQQGQPAYRLARRGTPLRLPPRQVNIKELELLKWHPPLVTLRAVVSSGTYIRALARDLGKAAGTVATLASLTRTRAGQFTLADALPLHQADTDTIVRRLIPVTEALPELPQVELTEVQARKLRQGQTVDVTGCADADNVLAVTASRNFLCLAAVHQNRIKPLRMIYAEK